MTEKEALILLNMVEGVGPRTILNIKEHYPDVSKVFGETSEVLTRKLELRQKAARSILEAPSKLDLADEKEYIDKEKIKVITFWEPDYPEILKQIYDPPPILYVKGNYNFSFPSLGLVGARSSTHYGNQTAYRLAFQLASSGIAVTSGLARGIDTHAHRGALAAKGVTVAVMGCGFRHFYPAENKSLANQIIEKGCLISEFPTKVAPLSQNFPRRNRIISGISLGIVVVEAARRSGSLITADLALEQGRSVFAVPGRVDSPSSSGTLGLIKEGAKIVQTVDDIFEEIGLQKSSLLLTDKNSGKRSLDPDEEVLLSLIGSEPMNVDEVSRRAQMQASRVLALLFTLELKRLVKQLPGKHYVRADSEIADSSS